MRDVRTCDGVLDLDTGVDLDKVVAVLLIDQELGSSSVLVLDMLGQLDGIVQNGVADRGRKRLGWGNLDDLLVTTLDRAITLKQMNNISLAVGKQLDLDVAGLVEESLNEHGAVAKGLLGLGSSTLKAFGKVGLRANNTHSTSSTTHGSLDDDGESIFCKK